MPQSMLDKLSTRALRNTAVLLGMVLAVAIVALVLSIENRVQRVPQVAKQAAREQAVWVAIPALRHESVLTCRRLNVTRATDNAAHLQNYQLYQFLLVATARAQRRARHEKHAKKIARGERRELRRLERGQVLASWTPLIDCGSPNATQKSLSLQPIPFTRRLPPASALSPMNAGRLDPRGSVS